MLALAASPALAQTPTPPGAPSISSVTGGDRQLAVNWSAATSPSDKPVVDYEVQYRAGSSGDWTTSSTYGVTFESIVQSGSDPTWAHNRNPLDLGTVTGDAAAYIERTKGGRHNLDGVYRLKQAVAAVHIRVNGVTDGAATLRSNYTDSAITDLRHNGDSMGANAVTSAATSFELTGEKRGLLANSYIWIDGWDHTSTNAKFPEFEDVSISSRRLRIQIATASTALNTNISDLTNQQSYQVRVRARNSDGWGNWSVVSTGTPLGTPEAPSGLSSVSGNNQLDVSWSAPGNNGGYAISDYDIQYRARSGETWGSWTYWQESTVSTATSTTIDTPIANGTTYQVRVRAVNSAGDGDWSDAVTDAAGKPSPPTFQLSTVRRPLPEGKTDRGGLLSITLSAVNNGSAVSDYDLRYRESGTSTWYTYRDRSHDTGRLSGNESASNTDPIDFGTFSTPSGAVAVTRESLGSGYVYKFSKAVDVLWIRASGTITGGGTVYAHWHDSKPTAGQVSTLGTQIFSATADSVSGAFWQDGWVTNLPANGYVWFYTADQKTLTKRRLQLDFTDNSTSGAMVLTGLRNGSTYELQARATNDRGTGAWSASVSGTAGVPTPPVVDTPTPKHESLDVSWAAPASDNAAEVTGYDVQYRAGSSGAWSSWPHTGTTRTATITGLTNNTEYEVRVRAKNERGNSFWSATVKATPVPQKPDAPAAPTLTSSGTTMTVSWTAPLANGAGITDYDIEYSSDNGANWTEWNASNTSTGLSASIPNLVNGTTYQVRVRAQNSVGEGDWSPASTHTVGRPSAPAAPTLTSGDRRLTVNWSAPAGTVTITDYDVRYCSSNCDVDANWTSMPDTTDSTALSATIPNLNNGTTYYVQVRAESSVGPGPWSPTAIVKAGLPDAPSPVTVQPASSGLTITWPNPAVAGGREYAEFDVRSCPETNDCTQESAWTVVPINSPFHPTEILLQNVTNGVDYQIQVRAKNEHGNSPWSDVQTETPGTPLAPGAPTLTAGDHKLLVNWSAPTNNGAAISDYDVRYKESSASAWSEIDDTTDSAARSAVITGLTPEETYQVQVRATNTHGDSAWSGSSTHTLAVSPVPIQTLHYCDPGKINPLWVDDACLIKAGQHGTKPFHRARIAFGGDYVELTDYSGTVEALAYNPNGGLATIETLDTNNVVQDTFLVDVIQFQIRSAELSGNLKAGVWTNFTVRLHSPDHSSPDKYMTNGTDIARSWVRLSLPNTMTGRDHLGSNADDPVQVVGQHGDSVTFSVYAINSGDQSITISAFRPAPDAGCPTEGELRCFQPPIAGLTKNYVAAAEVTAQATFAAPNPPAAPANLTAGAGDGSVTLSWDNPQNPTITGYEYNVNHNDTNTGNFSGWSAWQSISGSDSETTSHTLSGLTNGREYRFHVRAVNAGGPGTGAPNAAPWYVAATPEEPPDPPGPVAAVNVTRADGTLTASWDAPDRATSYHVTYRAHDGQWQLAALNHTGTSITINGVDNTKTYTVGVRARNISGDSSWRNSPPAGPYTPPGTPETPAPPGPVAAVSVTRADGSLTASWDAPDRATSYHITYRAHDGNWQLAALNHTGTSIQHHDQRRRQHQDVHRRRARAEQQRRQQLAQFAARRAVHAAADARSTRPARHAVLGHHHPHGWLPDRILGCGGRREQVPRHLLRRRRRELARARRRPHERAQQQHHVQRRQRQELHHRRPRRQRCRLERLAQLAVRRAIHAALAARQPDRQRRRRERHPQLGQPAEPDHHRLRVQRQSQRHRHRQLQRLERLAEHRRQRRRDHQPHPQRPDQRTGVPLPRARRQRGQQRHGRAQRPSLVRRGNAPITAGSARTRGLARHLQLPAGSTTRLPRLRSGNQGGCWGVRVVSTTLRQARANVLARAPFVLQKSRSC